MYSVGSGRAKFVKEAWKDQGKEQELKQRLTPIQYKVTQENGDNRLSAMNTGMRNDRVFMSISSMEHHSLRQSRLNSNCGWPSFAKPISEDKMEV